MKDYAAIALDVRCDVCDAPPGLGCLRRDGTGRTEPHPSRVNEARLAAIGKHKEPDAKWLELAAIWRDASEADRAGILAVVKARMALPHGVDAVVRVLGCHGTFAVLPDRLDPLGHIRAAWRHGLRTRDVVDLAASPEWPRDAETGELHAAHEAGRALIACELVGRGK